ncbi:MAG: DNA primase [Nitrosopumilaceae archaeon]|nr:DNA primase [Nitrosopumilaceae archaeon]NIU00278.1 DNA primase [Nitrosopumilaceae archaeon]NIU86690.1 DNA primase [Nitrosopumilaceae archaeon]NIV65385.1 DNA primase [Nitrosopumilaceae archaeon]NIX60880.1 DNA primase [Nitrosopumilaceae archaeon]
MIAVGHEEISKYPFLADAGNYLKDKGFTLEQFGTDPDLKIILNEAFNRVIVASEGKIYKSNSETEYTSSLPKEVFSFLLAIVLLKLCGMNTLIRRFSLAEARRAEGFLEKDLLDNRNQNRDDLVKRILGDLFSISIEKKGDKFAIPISNFLEHSINFHEKEWKLVNRLVEDGYVLLSNHETVRLIRKELSNFINSKVNSVKTPQMPQGFEEYVTKLTKLGKKFSVPMIQSTEYPPCIKHAIEVLEKGENLPHSGRFLLATYLLSKGKPIDDIVPLFKNAPDYNEKITRYQLNHLAGDSGSGTKYSCPSCEKLETQNLCFAIPECNGIINPLQFGRKRK